MRFSQTKKYFHGGVNVPLVMLFMVESPFF